MALLALLVAASPAGADDRAILPALVATGERQAALPEAGIAMGGYDPVSYQLDRAPRAGLAEFEIVWAGHAWRFASAANRAAFRVAPPQFRPRVGGYDALAAGAGRIVGADPLVFAVVDGALYLFRDAERRRAFLAEAGAAQRAEAGWARLERSLVRE